MVVPVPPTIEEGLTEVAATVNTRTSLECETLGLPEPSVSWKKDGKPIRSSGPRYRMHRSGTLEFSAVNVIDTGVYECIAENAAGTVSREITLKVLGMLVLRFNAAGSEGCFMNTGLVVLTVILFSPNLHAIFIMLQVFHKWSYFIVVLLITLVILICFQTVRFPLVQKLKLGISVHRLIT